MNYTTSRPVQSNSRPRAILTLVCICLLTVIGTSATAEQWQGREETKEGVLHVLNPDVAMETPSEIVLEERWRIGGDTDDEDEFFGILTHVTVDDEGNVYLLDSQLHQVMIYTPQGDFVRAIGREGEGPGEFRRPSGMLMVPGGNVGVIQSRPGKIVVLTPGGEPAGNHPIPEAEDGGVQFFFAGLGAGDQILLGVLQFSRLESGAEITSKLIRVGPDGKQTASYFKRSESRNFANVVIDEKNSRQSGIVWGVGPDGRVYASMEFEAYLIDVWLQDGQRDRIIERAYQPRQRSSEEIKRAGDRMPVRMGRRRRVEPEKKISKTDRDILGIYPRDDGSLWVISSRGALDAPDGVVGVFDVFDEEGRYVRQVTLKGEGSFPSDGLHFVGERLYVVTGLQSARDAMFGGGSETDYDEEADEDLEPMSVICYDLGLRLHGMKQ